MAKAIVTCEVCGKDYAKGDCVSIKDKEGFFYVCRFDYNGKMAVKPPKRRK